jgi:aspartyl-tRNA(Asn)/glutamyl-tRNA(Gln) amidotransferase subunit B
LESGGKINQETRNYNAEKGITVLMRTKESADDYRYFPEPDLPPVLVTEEKVTGIKNELPPLPEELYIKYTQKYELSEYDANVIMENKDFALYFDKLTSQTHNYKAAVNWMMGEVKSYLNKNALEINAFPLKPEAIAELIEMTDSNKVSYTTATQKIFPLLLQNPALKPLRIAEENNLLLDSDSANIEGFIREALAKYPDKVKEYKEGKKGLTGLFMGEVMKLSKGKVDPKIANKMLNEILEKL